MGKKTSKTKAEPLSASIRAEAVAKATYSRKKTTTEVIPPDVSRAKANAWLTLISPLTEWAGLRGDELRHKRELLRIQRDETLAEIGERAIARRKVTALAVAKPIPTKFLVPFLEQASLEEPDSPLIDLWANLLASASEEFSSTHIHFVSILSRLSSEQAKLFEAMIQRAPDLHWLEIAQDESHWFRDGKNFVELLKANRQQGQKIRKLTADVLDELVEEALQLPTIVWVHTAMEIDGQYYDLMPAYRTYADDQEADYSILEALGLLRKVETGFIDFEEAVIAASYYHLSALGFYLAKACKIIPEGDDDLLSGQERPG
jgi:hypothetical protein